MIYLAFWECAFRRMNIKMGNTVEFYVRYWGSFFFFFNLYLFIWLHWVWVWHTGLVVVAVMGLVALRHVGSYFPKQGWNWCLMHYKADFFFFFCSEFCHTLKWNSHGFTCVPHPYPPSHLPLHPIPLGLPSAPGPSACLMHPTWAGDLFHPR